MSKPIKNHAMFIELSIPFKCYEMGSQSVTNNEAGSTGYFNNCNGSVLSKYI